MLTIPSDGGTQGTPRLGERVSSPLRIYINSVVLTLLVITVLLHDIYTLFGKIDLVVVHSLRYPYAFVHVHKTFCFSMIALIIDIDSKQK